MSAQRLSDRSRRRIERSTGLAIVRAWAHGGYVFDFVTVDHQHGSWDKRTGEWQLDDDPTHYSSCAELFSESNCVDHPTLRGLVEAREAPVVAAAAESAARFGAALQQGMQLAVGDQAVEVAWRDPAGPEDRAAVVSTVMQSSE
ncbi:hypothetical protein SEA_MITTI_43 [Mycobacterium phage Mitti]|uniref:Uncharacterized protein n=1 Tax=Mycobacterium phage Mitti TaxID=1917488 RepID=A0A1J0MDZ3_9CAUD|nr:hypothetical protein SEA_MITTI_43 [Mycobacterium phage Mitti]